MAKHAHYSLYRCKGVGNLNGKPLALTSAENAARSSRIERYRADNHSETANYDNRSVVWDGRSRGVRGAQGGGGGKGKTVYNRTERVFGQARAYRITRAPSQGYLPVEGESKVSLAVDSRSTNLVATPVCTVFGRVSLVISRGPSRCTYARYSFPPIEPSDTLATALGLFPGNVRRLLHASGMEFSGNRGICFTSTEGIRKQRDETFEK